MCGESCGEWCVWWCGVRGGCAWRGVRVGGVWWVWCAWWVVHGSWFMVRFAWCACGVRGALKGGGVALVASVKQYDSDWVRSTLLIYSSARPLLAHAHTALYATFTARVVSFVRPRSLAPPFGNSHTALCATFTARAFSFVRPRSLAHPFRKQCLS